MKLKVVIILAVLVLGIQQALAQDQIFGRPNYAYSYTMSKWGNCACVSSHSTSELYEAAYAAVAGGAHIRGWMHRDFTWTGDSGPATARFDYAFCAEVAVGTAYSSVEIKVTGFLRDVTSCNYPIHTTLYRYSKSSAGYRLFIYGDVANKPIDMVEGHDYTIGYRVDVSAICYPRSYCPMACANVGEQGCSFWWQPTGIFGG